MTSRGTTIPTARPNEEILVATMLLPHRREKEEEKEEAALSPLPLVVASGCRTADSATVLLCFSPRRPHYFATDGRKLL